MRLVALALSVVVLVAGCASSNPAHRQAEADDDGVQATGVLDGSRVAISRGVPDVVFGDCDANDGLDDDICWTARTIDGLTVTFVIENPAVLEVGERIEVVDEDCGGCDDVVAGVVVEVRANGASMRAVTGEIEVLGVPSVVPEGQSDPRAAATFDVDFPGGDTLSGAFNVRELRPEER